MLLKVWQKAICTLDKRLFAHLSSVQMELIPSTVWNDLFLLPRKRSAEAHHLTCTHSGPAASQRFHGLNLTGLIEYFPEDPSPDADSNLPLNRLHRHGLRDPRAPADPK